MPDQNPPRCIEWLDAPGTTLYGRTTTRVVRILRDSTYCKLQLFTERHGWVELDGCADFAVLRNLAEFLLPVLSGSPLPRETSPATVGWTQTGEDSWFSHSDTRVVRIIRTMGDYFLLQLFTESHDEGKQWVELASAGRNMGEAGFATLQRMAEFMLPSLNHSPSHR